MFQGMEYVYEVYKAKSFSKAAQNLYISQPSLSAAVKKIEGRIRAQIFDRSTNPVQLTECGVEYIKSIEKIMDIENSFDSYLNNLNELKTGRISIGGSSFFISFILPPLITAFAKRFPLVEINLVEANTTQLEKQLSTGLLDLVIDNYTFSESLYQRHLFCKEHLVLTVPKKFISNYSVKDFQLTTRDIIAGKHLDPNTLPVSLKHFEEDPFIFLRSGNDTRIRAEKICLHHEINPRIVLKLDQQVTAYNVACYGMGVTFLSDTLIQNVKPDPNVLYYKISDPDTARSVFFFHKNSKYITRAMEEFLKMSISK